MPEPFHPWATDHLVYKYITNPLAKNMCFVHPNLVTLAGAFSIIPIVLNIVKNGSKLALMFWMPFRSFIDCLDGSIARNCKKNTEIGSFFDILSDTSYVLSISVAILYNIFKNKLFGIAQWIIGLSMFIGSFTGLYEMFLETVGKGNKRFQNFIATSIHDNTFVINLLGAILINTFIKLPLGRPI